MVVMVRIIELADDDFDDQDYICGSNDKDEDKDDASLDVSHSQGFGLRL